MSLPKARIDEIFLVVESWEKSHGHEDFLYFLQVEKHFANQSYSDSYVAKKNHELVLRAAQEMSIELDELMQWFDQYKKETSF